VVGFGGVPVVSILGISAFYHDSAACLVIDGEIVAAAQEERFTRVKHDHNFPLQAVRYCLREAALTAQELDYVAFYDKPLLKFDRLLETYLDYAPAGFSSFLKSMPLWMREKLWMPDLIRTELAKAGGAEDERAAKKEGKKFQWKLLFGDHHESHAASAFYPSPFEEAAILTIDGVGEWATSSIGLGKGNEVTLLKELRFPDSLGLLYSAFTYYTGFKVNSGEYKVMGLAPYGEPKYVSVIKDKLLEIREDGSLKMNHQFFSYSQGLRMTNRAFARLLGGAPRKPESQITQREMDLARSIQVITEEVMLKMTKHAYKETGMTKLCMAGGVALNCVANGRVLREVPFDDIWIQPAAGDAGGALGIALAIWHRYLGKPRLSPEKMGTWQSSRAINAGQNNARSNGRNSPLPAYADSMKGSYLGPKHSEDEIEKFLKSKQLPYKKYSREELPEAIGSLLASGKIIGVHQGRMEFGPRALGARSIIGDPRSPQMQAAMNLKIKYRESFRPFAPSVLREQVADWFELNADSPYMLLVADVAESRRRRMTPEEEALWGIDKLNIQRSEIPAVTHVDYSARIQTVRREENPLYWEIIEAFGKKTGCPVVVNTSFNVRGEPIVCSPEDSYRCFMRTEMDFLMLETCVLDKKDQPAYAEDKNWRTQFRLD
jgi:carbamoyltransferase